MMTPENSAEIAAKREPVARRRLGRWALPKTASLAGYSAKWGLFFAAPLIVGLVVFVYSPLAMALFLSFTEYDVINPPRWTGLENIEYILGWDLFWKAFGNTAYIVAGFVITCTVVSLSLALALNQKIRGITLFRTSFFLPAVISMISAGLLWKWLYLPDFGALNWFISLFGLPAIPWVSSPTWAVPAIILMSVWKAAGYFAIIFLAALQHVPPEYHEAAKIDGASEWHAFWHVTLPLISPTTFFVVVTMIIGSAQVFDQIWVITKGGPNNATISVIMLIYRTGFELLKFGRASAVTLLFFLFIMAVTIIQFRLQRRWVNYEL